jgi:hypothetical protein
VETLEPILEVVAALVAEKQLVAVETVAQEL